MADLNVQTLFKSFGPVEVLHGVSIDMEDGEFVALVGPSGCGKSTLLRMIAGLEDVTAGTIRIGGRVVNDLAPRERDIAMVFQSYALYPHKTVEQNMGYALKLARVPKPEIRRKVEEAADILDLKPLLKRKPSQLSGGQRQRVAMGRAIVRDPKVFLFDEPLSNLDAKLRVQMRTEIKELHQRLSTTTVYVTHDQIEAMTMADRIVIMSNGNVEQVGTPLDLYDHPANLFVAGFLGSPAMNFVHGTVRTHNGGQVFETEAGLAMPLPHPVDDNLAGKPLVLGVRPEHLRMTGESDDHAFNATVTVTEPTGSETLIFARAEGADLSIVAKERVSIANRETLHLALPEQVHLFDKASGQSLAV